MKLITEALVGMAITKVNEDVICYVNGIFDALGITNEWLFAYCYLFKFFCISCIMTFFMSKLIGFLYTRYLNLLGNRRSVDIERLKQTRRSFGFISGSIIGFNILGLIFLPFFVSEKNEFMIKYYLLVIIVLSLIVGLYFVRLARGKINNVFQVCQVVIFAICIITMSACNIYGVFDHKNMYYMDDGYIEINLSMERAMHKYKIKTPLGTVMEIPMHIKNFPECCLFIDLSQIDYIAGIYRLETDIDEPSDFSNTIEIVFRGTEEEKSKYADRYIRLVSRCDEKFAQDNMEKLLKMKSAALNSDTKTFNKYMKSMEIKDPQIEIILNTMRLDKTFNMPFRQ